jgi:hypothetical protein
MECSSSKSTFRFARYPGSNQKITKNVTTKVTQDKLETLTYLTRGDIKGTYVCTHHHIIRRND